MINVNVNDVNDLKDQNDRDKLWILTELVHGPDSEQALLAIDLLQRHLEVLKDNVQGQGDVRQPQKSPIEAAFESNSDLKYLVCAHIDHADFASLSATSRVMHRCLSGGGGSKHEHEFYNFYLPSTTQHKKSLLAPNSTTPSASAYGYQITLPTEKLDRTRPSSLSASLSELLSAHFPCGGPNPAIRYLKMLSGHRSGIAMMRVGFGRSSMLRDAYVLAELGGQDQFGDHRMKLTTLPGSPHPDFFDHADEPRTAAAPAVGPDGRIYAFGGDRPMFGRGTGVLVGTRFESDTLAVSPCSYSYPLHVMDGFSNIQNLLIEHYQVADFYSRNLYAGLAETPRVTRSLRTIFTNSLLVPELGVTVLMRGPLVWATDFGAFHVPLPSVPHALESVPRSEALCYEPKTGYLVVCGGTSLWSRRRRSGVFGLPLKRIIDSARRCEAEARGEGDAAPVVAEIWSRLWQQKLDLMRAGLLSGMGDGSDLASGTTSDLPSFIRHPQNLRLLAMIHLVYRTGPSIVSMMRFPNDDFYLKSGSKLDLSDFLNIYLQMEDCTWWETLGSLRHGPRTSCEAVIHAPSRSVCLPTLFVLGGTGRSTHPIPAYERVPLKMVPCEGREPGSKSRLHMKPVVFRHRGDEGRKGSSDPGDASPWSFTEVWPC